MFKRPNQRVNCVRLLQSRIEMLYPLRGSGPTGTLLMHLAKCEWSKATTSDSLQVAHIELGTMDVFTSPDAQLKRWLSYTGGQIILEGLRARAE